MTFSHAFDNLEVLIYVLLAVQAPLAHINALALLLTICMCSAAVPTLRVHPWIYVVIHDGHVLLRSLVALALVLVSQSASRSVSQSVIQSFSQSVSPVSQSVSQSVKIGRAHV